MTRARLPNRRAAVTLEFDHVTPGLATIPYVATVGFHDDGRIGEVFLNTAMVGTDLDVATKDAAILLSFALQHGASARDIAARALLNDVARESLPWEPFTPREQQLYDAVVRLASERKARRPRRNPFPLYTLARTERALSRGAHR